MIFLATAWRWISGAAAGAWRAVAASKPLQYMLGGLLAFLATWFGVSRALKKTREAGRLEGEDKVFDRIERDTKRAIQKIEEAERDLSQTIGPPPVMEDRGDGRGLSSDDLNKRQLDRLRRVSEADPRNRRNPREDPRG